MPPLEKEEPLPALNFGTQLSFGTGRDGATKAKVAELQAKSRTWAADPEKGAERFRPPPEVEAYFAELDRAGRVAALSCRWWQEFLQVDCGERGEDCCNKGAWVHGWPLHAKHPDATEGYEHREVAPLHYVMGRLSPFYIDRAFRRDRSRAVWIVYFGPYTSTGDSSMGVGSGGAIASILDLITANLAGIYVGGMAATSSINIRMLQPAKPMPGSFKAEAWVEKEEKDKVYVRAEFSDGEGTIFDTCDAVLFAKSRRDGPSAKRSKL